MREFYLNLLQNMNKLTGFNQYNKLRELPNYKDEINGLLDVLCRVSDIFKYIPEDAQKNIISDSIITDSEFTGLNARIVYKWFNLRKDIYYKEIAHIETQNQPEPVTGQKREEWLKIWTQQLDSISDEFSVKPVSNAEIMREKFMGNQSEPSSYKPDQEKGKAKLVHMEYVKANYDTAGYCLETWLPEDEWIAKNFSQQRENI